MTKLTGEEQALLERASEFASLDTVRRWALVNSGTRNLSGLSEVADMIAGGFDDLPGKIELREPAPVTAVGANGTEGAIEHGKHLVVTVRPDAPVQCLFTGHMDTVFAVDSPFQTISELPDGSLNGPGLADMKGGIQVMLAALKSIEGSPLSSQFGYQVMINSDEETGSLSSAGLINELARGKAAAFTYEPALPDGTLAGARGGTGNFSITIHGKSAHAGRNPEEGRNALIAAAEIAVRLKALTTVGLSVNPAKIDGGGPNNIVPDLAILRVNFRPASLEMQEFAGTQLRAIVADVERMHDVHTHIHGGFGRPPKAIDDRAGRLFELVKSCGADLGLNIAWRATGGVCDGNNIAACGVPVVDTMGVRGGAIHSSDEFLIVESLAERARLSALTIKRLIEKGSV